MSRTHLLLLAALLALLAQPLVVRAQPIFVDGRRLGAAEARVHQDELHVPLLPLAEALGVRVNLNRHTGTATLLGREVPMVLLDQVAYLPQSQLYGLFQLEVLAEVGRVDLCSPGYRPEVTVDTPSSFEVRSTRAVVEGAQLVVRARVTPGRGRVRVLLRRPDGGLYASFVTSPGEFPEESDLVVPTWLSGDVSVRPDGTLQVRDYALKGEPPTTHFLLVEASTEP
ncbi:MAG: hypothetical protein AB1758_12055 [Candidatus Eremiobacterota bacterium]